MTNEYEGAENRQGNGRREEDQIRKVQVDSLSNGAQKQAKRLERICIAAVVAVVLAIPTTIWGASWWARGMEASITLIAERMEAAVTAIDVRDSTMVAELNEAVEELGEHKADDEARDAALSAAVQEISVTMEGVVALQGVMQNEVVRIRNQLEDL